MFLKPNSLSLSKTKVSGATSYDFIELPPNISTRGPVISSTKTNNDGVFTDAGKGIGAVIGSILNPITDTIKNAQSEVGMTIRGGEQAVGGAFSSPMLYIGLAVGLVVFMQLRK